MAGKDFNSMNSYIGPPGSGGGGSTEYSTIGDAIRNADDDSFARITQAADVPNNIPAIDFTSKISGGVFEHNPFEHEWKISKVDSTFAPVGSAASILWYHAVDDTPFTLNASGTCSTAWSSAKSVSTLSSSYTLVGIEINYPVVAPAGMCVGLKEFVSPVSASYGLICGLMEPESTDAYVSVATGGGASLGGGATNAFGFWPSVFNTFSTTTIHLNEPVKQRLLWRPTYTNSEANSEIEIPSGTTVDLQVGVPTVAHDFFVAQNPLHLFYYIRNSDTTSFTFEIQTIGGCGRSSVGLQGGTPV